MVSGDFCEHDWPGTGCKECRAEREARLADPKEEKLMRIYIASKALYRPYWRELRRNGLPIISRWIDVDDGIPDEQIDFTELWEWCIQDVQNCDVLIAVAQPGERLKGVLIEIGGALTLGKRVMLFGDPGRENGTWFNHEGIERRMENAPFTDIFAYLTTVRAVD